MVDWGMLAVTGTYAPTVIHCHRHRGSMDTQPGPRPFYRLMLIDEGRCRIRCGAQRFWARPGDIYAVTPGMAHEWRCPPGARTITVAFLVIARALRRPEPWRQVLNYGDDVEPQSGPEAVWGCAWPTALPGSLAAAIRDAVRFIAATWWLSDDHHLEADHRLGYVLGRIVRQARGGDEEVTQVNTHPVGRVLDVIHRHYAMLRTAGDIAAHLGLSVSRMNETFRQAAGETPVACLRRYRLNEVERLLLTTNMSVKEIAAVTGFLDNQALHRAWNTVHDLPPRRWRLLHEP